MLFPADHVREQVTSDAFIHRLSFCLTTPGIKIEKLHQITFRAVLSHDLGYRE